MKTNSTFVFFAGLLLSAAIAAPSFAQSIPVGTPAIEEVYRRMQLATGSDSSVSFLVRPLDAGSMSRRVAPFATEIRKAGKSDYVLLPIVINQQLTTKLPYGWNDGALLPARGYQTEVSAGLYVRRGGWSVQVQPDFIYADNRAYEGFPAEYPNFMWSRYYDFYYGITDAPTNLGKGAYQKLALRQTSVKYTWKGLTGGVSNENLWWGPGKRNSLVMSNTAAGFNHITLHTQKPLATPVGTFEGQLIAGRLEDSGLDPPEASRMYNDLSLYTPRNTDWRLLSGMVLAYQPKWVKGLFVGYATTAQSYHNEVKGADYLPFVLPFRRFSGDNASRTTDRYRSFFARWALPESKAEVYLEYGVQNHGFSYQDIPVKPAGSYAYVAGISKLFVVGSRGDQLALNLEFTDMASSGLKKAGESWYVNNYIRQGYTHRGQFLGAGIGPGSNQQAVDLSWNRGLKKIGIGFDRYLHNNELYYYFFTSTKDVRRHWVDLNTSIEARWDFGKLLVTGSWQSVKSLNYQYIFDSANEEVAFAPGKDIKNNKVVLNLAYQF